MKKIIFYSLIICLTAGCTKRELMQYKGSTSIYFANGPTDEVYQDTIHYNFATDTLKRDTLYVNVYVLGEVAANNRSFTITSDAGNSTAVAGHHYLLPVTDSLAIPAGQESRMVPVIVLRPADLYEQSVTLTLKLLPDNNFKTNMPVYDHKSSYVKSAVTMRIVIGDVLAEPEVWDVGKDALGTYSRRKLELMVGIFSLSLQQFYDSDSYSAIQLIYFARQLQAYLNQQQQEGHPVLEADGSVMKMGPAVQ